MAEDETNLIYKGKSILSVEIHFFVVVSGTVSHVGFVVDVDAATGGITIIHSYPHLEDEPAIQEITAEAFFSKGNHIPGTEEVRALKDTSCCSCVIQVAKRLLGEGTIKFDSRFDLFAAVKRWKS